ncbi:MAG: permease-like cell division protein FtsX [Aureispira sp.]
MSSSNTPSSRLASFRQPAVWLSLALLLYGLGIAGLLGVYAQAWLSQARQSVSFYVELKEEGTQANIFAFQKELEKHQAVQVGSVQYINKEQALEDWDAAETGISKEELLIAGQNPLPNVLIWALSGEYTGDLEELVAPWKEEKVVEELAYTDLPLQEWQEGIRQAEGLLLLLLCLFVAVVYVLLRNNSKLALREALAEEKLTLKILQERYQRQSWRKGLLSALIAIAGLWGTRFWLEQDWESLDLGQLEFWTSLISGLLLLGGLALPWLAARGKLIKEKE